MANTALSRQRPEDPEVLLVQAQRDLLRARLRARAVSPAMASQWARRTDPQNDERRGRDPVVFRNLGDRTPGHAVPSFFSAPWIRV